MALKNTYRNMASLTAVDPDDVNFHLFTDEDIRKLSIAKITNKVSFDVMGNPMVGSLYDPAMGPSQKEFCITCNGTILNCPGHMGHIELPVVVVNPLFIKKIYTLFRMTCLKCFKIQLDEYNRKLLKLQLDLVDAGHITAALDLNQFIGVGDAKDSGKGKYKKIFKKYKKLLLTVDPVAKTFQNKNSSVIRAKIFNNFFKMINITRNCAYCKGKLIKITTNENKLMYNKAAAGAGKGIKILLPDEIREYCSKIAENDEDILRHCIPILKHTNANPITNAFFMEALPVPPPVVRPCNYMKGELMEHPQTNVYKTVLGIAFTVRVILQVLASENHQKAVDSLDTIPRQSYQSAFGKTAAEKLHNSWQELQKSVNQILDCEGTAIGSTSLGLKQIIERKTGVIRMHMMGKRVNFAARSVITPDPNVDIDEIGVPDAFAKKLTYPVPVTEYNVELLRKMVINGPLTHPGAELIEIENGRTIRIPPYSKSKRESIAKRLLTPDEFKSSGLKIVHRHLLNGDVLILNRQPSLHKPSMMAHRARILKGEKTLRLHYANCKSYNADFDGDEMNAHFPQNEIARSEAYNIMSVCKQYLVPKDGTPLGGLIQDHVIAGVKMSLRGSFFNKSDYQQLVFQALANHKGKIKLLSPTILKPVVLWSGKQVLSTIIINNIPKDKPCLTLQSNAKISAKAWQKEPGRQWAAGGSSFENPNTMTEAEVIIRKGELMCGVLDKNHYGATPYGLVHCMFELYGGVSSCALLSSFSKVFSYYLQWTGFSLGVKDILVVDEADKVRDDLIFLVRQSGKAAAGKATEMAIDIDEHDMKYAIEDKLMKDPKFRANLDRQYKSILDTYTNKINTACLSQGLLEKFPYNNLQLMVQSGAKGSTVNTMQISCLLGQIELEGKRPPIMISGKSLPSFPAYDLTPRAGGFIDGRFMTGIQPQEFFFHCMAGREGLIDTAVKTSRSGYLQRCLIKHLEGISVGYDHTVRDSDSSVVQFAYGEDGLDVLKCQYLNSKQLEFLDINSGAVISKSFIKKLKKESDPKAIQKRKKALAKWIKRNGDPFNKITMSGFNLFSTTAKAEINIDNVSDNTRDPNYIELEKKWREMADEEKTEYQRKSCPEPIQSKFAPEFKYGVMNEQLENIINNYLKNRKTSFHRECTEEEKFIDVMHTKYLASMADPGEPVGLLAAQSIGEPSTQMTLNTFHFAGRGDMNVTLGIPRLREILMTASANLKTPNMDIPFRVDIGNITKKAEHLRRKLNRVTVADVLEKIDVGCNLVVKPDRQLRTTIRFSFLPHSQYKTQYSVKPSQIINHMQKKFFSEMFSVIRKQAKASGGIVWTEEKDKRRPAAKQNYEDSDQEDEPKEQKKKKADDEDSSDEDEGANEDDADNTDARLRSKRQEEQEYEDPEADEIENEEDEDQDYENNNEENEPIKPQVEISEQDSKIMAGVVEKHKSASNYTFDTKHHQWCELTANFPISFLKIDMTQALREAASKSIIYEVKNIKRAITVSEKGSVTLKTEGINIIQMFQYEDLLDINRLYSNDIHAIANTYGIEAATKVIIKEIKNVFGVYGITVDPRHLSLISDYMTFNGVFEPMSRKGMESATSPLQQMSFESSIVFLKEAVLNAKTDSLNSPSSCLMIGQPCHLGTGAFSLQHCSNLSV